MKSLIVRAYIVPKRVLWLGFAGMLGNLLWSVASGEWFPAAVWLGSILPAIRLLGPGTTVEADSELIRYSMSARCWEIKWSEVTKIETSPNAIVLHGHSKRLAMPGASMWKSEGKEQMLAFIQTQSQAWNIPQHQTLAADFRASKNTKISPTNRRPPLSL